MAPEWLKTTEITSKADVYSYGIMLLRLVRGLHNRGDDEESLVDWAYHFISAAEEEERNHEEEPSISNGGEDSVGVQDELVTDSYESDRLEKTRVLKIALWSVQYQPELRPSMLRIAQLLEGNGEVIGIPSYPAPSVVLVGYQSSSTSTNIASYMADSDVAISAR